MYVTHLTQKKAPTHTVNNCLRVFVFLAAPLPSSQRQQGGVARSRVANALRLGDGKP